MLIEVDKLTKSYPHVQSGDLPVLTGVDLQVDAGTTLAITGQSGSGKSTLISLLAGLDRPDSGHIRIAGHEVTALNEAQLTRFRASHVGIVFQQFHLLPHLTAEENITLPLELLRRRFEQDRIESLMASVGLVSRRHHLPGQLSGGECQRVAIARALAVEPIVLLADEPTGNLDTGTGNDIADLLFHLAEHQRMTMIVVTHNRDLAARCTRQQQLHAGRLQ